MLLSNKKVITSLLCALAIFSLQPLQAKDRVQSCERQAFNIKTSEKLTILEVVNELANKCNFSVITKDIEAKKALEQSLAGLNITNMSLHEVFNLVLSENGINYKYKRGVLKLNALLTTTFKVDYITSIREGTATLSASSDIEIKEAGEGSTKIEGNNNEIKVQEKFDFWKTLSQEIVALLNNGSETFVAKEPIINKNTGLITITATKSQIDRVKYYLKELKNRLHKQVLIDVSIIAVELANDYTTGIDWSKFQLSINTKNVNGKDMSTGGGSATFLNTLNRSSKNLSIINNVNFSMEGLLNFIKQKGNSKILSNPKVMTLNNQQALITVGDNINYRVLEKTDIGKDGTPKITYTPYSIFIGVLLNILPEISDDNKIMLRINPSLSNFKYSEDDRRQEGIREVAPDTLEKKLSTVVQVGDGDTIILGGLIGQTKAKNKTSVPFFGSLPVVGKAFRSTQDVAKTTELVFVITPRIINADNSKNISTSLKDLGFSESIYE